jgi:type II secretory pathway component PulF
MPASDTVEITRQLAMLARLGHDPTRALEAMAATLPFLAPLAEEQARGMTAGESAAGHPEIFSAFQARMLEAAETSPRPLALLENLSRWTERADRVRERLSAALFYPWLLVNFMLIELAFLAEVALPRVAPPLASPPLGRLIEALSASHALTILAGAALVGFNLVARTRAASPLPHARQLRLAADEALWLRALGSLLEAGIALPDALREAAAIVTVGTLRVAVERLAPRVERGEPLSRVLETQRGLDPLLAWAASAGEARENLAAAFLEAAAALDAHLDRRIDVALRLAQPWALVGVGGGIACALLLFWQPFYATIGALQ